MKRIDSRRTSNTELCKKVSERIFLTLLIKTIHLILDYPYVEPIGSFYSSDSSMDDVLIVSMVGAIAILIVYFLFNLVIIINDAKILSIKYRK